MFCFRTKKIKTQSKISESEASELVEDRIKFKLFSADQHYDKLVQYQQEEGTDFLKTFVSRIRFEDELECLLAHLIGARDALLMRIRDKLGLPLKDNEVCLSNINRELKSTKYPRLLCEMSCVSHGGFWLDLLNQLRNTGIHRRIIPIKKGITIYENLNNHTTTTSPWKITFTFEDGQTLELLPYLKDSMQKMKDLIERILQKENILHT